MPTNQVEFKSGRVATIGRIECPAVVDVQLYSSGKMVGRAFMIESKDRDQVMLFDVTVFDECDRRKGAGTELLTLVTDIFPDIVTEWHSEAGKNLCLKLGFKLVKPLFKKLRPYLHFKREGFNAVTEGKVEEGDQQEHLGTGEEGKATEAGGSDSDGCRGKSQEKGQGEVAD